MKAASALLLAFGSRAIGQSYVSKSPMTADIAMQTKGLGIKAMEANPLMKVVVDLIIGQIVEAVVGEKEEHQKTNLYVNSVEKVDMLNATMI